MPRFGSTSEYEALVVKVTGKDYRWFFDVYLRQAALPDLVETRTGDPLTLAWRVPGNGPFPLPIDITVDGIRGTLPMTDGRGMLTISEAPMSSIDPDARVLRRSIAVEEMQTWQSWQRK
ncbi:hypothetical protein [Sphingomonas mollis]|uniref:Uncharacterized protein n=1 Tax=Sphingomonas mollis TaxID=2795726 RepID=A0ABS0XLS7_9SPHN|nr:hypothetical protein [Sphingomonas sp. BT553]MBJ6120765.1 hypothetical protein [Sphingomonas sp. BT553]